MKRKLIRINSHIKWSHNKFGNLIIFNRLSKNNTIFIKSTTGKEIWNLLIKNLYNTKAISKSNLLDKLYKLFAGSVSLSVLTEDVELFLDNLLNENIINITAIP